MVRRTTRKKLYKVGTYSKGKFRSSMQAGTGFSSLKRAKEARKFFQTTTKKKIKIVKK